MLYTINSEKLMEITRLYNQQAEPGATEEVVQATICGDWNEGDEHQEWLDMSEPQTIVDWLISTTFEN